MDRLFITDQMMFINIKHVIFIFQYSVLKSELKVTHSRPWQSCSALQTQHKQYCKLFIPWHRTKALPRNSSHPKCHTVSTYTSKCNFTNARKYVPPCPGFHGSHKCYTALRTDLFRRISLKSANKCGQYGQKLISKHFGYQCAEFRETHNHAIIFVSTIYAEF
jgi:hypothetical protein